MSRTQLTLPVLFLTMNFSNEIMASFDVESLFTSVPVNEVLRNTNDAYYLIPPYKVGHQPL